MVNYCLLFLFLFHFIQFLINLILLFVKYIIINVVFFSTFSHSASKLYDAAKGETSSNILRSRNEIIGNCVD